MYSDDRHAARWRHWVAAAGLMVLAACGGGGSPNPPAGDDADVVELQATVQTIATGDPRGLAEPVEGRLTQSAGTPLEAGAVIVLADKAIKVTARRDDGAGGYVYDTATPRLAEVFERIRISGPVAAAGREQAASARERGARTFSIDRYELKPELGPAANFVDLGGAIEAATATVEFDWDRQRGLQRAELTLRGRLALAATLEVKAEQELKRFSVPVGRPLSIRIPQSFYLASIEVPVSVVVELKSEVSTRVATVSKVWDFQVGTRYDPAGGEWINASHFDEVGSNVDPVDATSLRSALASALPFVESRLQGTVTVASLTVGPAIKPNLALLKSVGAVGLRADLGFKAGLQVSGVYPELLQCAALALSQETAVYGYYDFDLGPFWTGSYPFALFTSGDIEDASAESVAIARREFKLFTLTREIDHPFKLGRCGDAVPYVATYRTLEATVGTPVCVATDPAGRCVGTMWCEAGDEVGEVATGTETWKLDGAALLAEMATDWMDQPFTHRGTYQPVSRTIVLPLASVTREVTPQGSPDRMFSTGTLAFDGAFDPVTRQITGTVATTVTTHWSRDARSVSCSTKFAYLARPAD